MIDRLRPGTAFGASFGMTLAAIGAGDLEQAADWLVKAIEQRDLWVSFFLNVGNLGGRVMWSSPRWPQLARLMNLPSERALASLQTPARDRPGGSSTPVRVRHSHPRDLCAVTLRELQ